MLALLLLILGTVLMAAVIVIALGYFARRNLDRGFGLRERPEPVEPCDFHAVIAEHLATRDRHQEDVQLRRAG